MKKNPIGIWIVIWIISSGIAFWWDNFFVWNNQSNIPWVYNPISWFYEQKSADEIEIENEKLNKFDFYSDSSFQKFLDDNHSISTDYSINDTVKINSDFTFNRSSDFMLREKAAEMFEWMARAFSNAFNFKAKLSINSARRSSQYQRQLANNCSIGRCAKPWTSEHEAGLAVDLWVNGWNIKALSGIYYQWLIDNAHKYGFHNSYQKWMEIDGKIAEPWHWRYVWKELATILHDNNQTFSEYFYQNIESKF